MSLSLLITINVLADIALLGSLAYVMSRASKLRPHLASVHARQSQSPPVEQSLAQQRRPRRVYASRPQLARPGARPPTHHSTHAAPAHDSVS